MGMMISVDRPRTPEKPFDRVTRELRARIEAGEWPPGGQLPSVPALASQHKTSKATVTRVIAGLASDGLVTVVRGWGTFVAEK